MNGALVARGCVATGQINAKTLSAARILVGHEDRDVAIGIRRRMPGVNEGQGRGFKAWTFDGMSAAIMVGMDDKPAGVRHGELLHPA
jgi:hypothetical protein